MKHGASRPRDFTFQKDAGRTRPHRFHGFSGGTSAILWRADRIRQPPIMAGPPRPNDISSPQLTALPNLPAIILPEDASGLPTLGAALPAKDSKAASEKSPILFLYSFPEFNYPARYDSLPDPAGQRQQYSGATHDYGCRKK